MRLVAAVIASLVSLVVGSQGAVAAVIPDGQTTELTIVLSAPDRQGLRDLASATGISHADRMARLAALQPKQAQRDAVAATVARLGFTVTSSSGWTVSAKANAARVALHFGRTLVARPDSATSLPLRPAELGGLVSAVFQDSAATNVHHHHSIAGPTGQQLRTSYASPVGTAPLGRGGQTIATIQFSGWSPTDLTSYATAVGLPDPVSRGQYVGVAVGRSMAYNPADDGNGDGEVALDQEGLLSVAPALKQRAYFAANSIDGEIAAMHRIATDAADASHAFYGLVALSVSWGACEDAYLLPSGAVDSASLNAELDAYSNVLASGVTIFASSGDSGAYDCSIPGARDAAAASELAVDTPGSFPYVVSVGGTRLQLGDPGTNADDTETAWERAGRAGEAPYRGDGGGGGRSKLFSRPDYQSGLSLSGTDRLVPDISMLADPDAGISIYWSRGGSDPWGQVGGTSLSAPLAAGMFADALAQQGATVGIGSIHSYLYSSPSYTGSDQTLRDITSGDNSFGFEPSHLAGVGYDLSSGLGAPIWSGLGTRFRSEPQVNAAAVTRSATIPITITVPNGTAYTGWRAFGVNDGTDPGTLLDCSSGSFDLTAPSNVSLPAGDGSKAIYVLARNATGCVLGKTSTKLDTRAPTLALTTGLQSPTSSTVTAKWSAADAGGVDHYRVKITHSLASTPDLDIGFTTSTSETVVGVAGRTYTIAVTAFDAAGNQSTSTKKVDVPYDDKRFGFSGHWQRNVSSADFAGSLNASSTSSSSATARVTFRAASVLLAFSPYAGKVDIYVDNRRVKTIDTYSSSTRYRVAVPIASFASAGTHTVQLKVLGTKASAARGTNVYLDALVLSS